MPNEKVRAKIAKSFGSASQSYDVSARLQRYSGKYLMPWLPNRNDLTVLDLGCGTGFFTNILAEHFDQVIGLDFSNKMLHFAKEQRSDVITWLEADAYKLPIADNSIDLIYSNLMIQWCADLDSVLTELLRVLKPGGLFIFSTLIDGTLFELKSSWAQVDNDKHVIDFRTEQELNTLFNGERCKLLTQESKDIILEYENVIHLARELKGLGANKVPNKLSKGLAGKDKWQKMTTSYQDFVEPNGIYPATYRIYSGMLVKLTY
ncbi:malonyl-ACP O-methyltransferase BioC [Thalassotalea sp. G2M2-11]|uniref:malonyl-ACP O-methyltransferase BioC n=1 Tax=Thalassotalea sp. G2M2-11 TaxID=2787627 RepID=UPI0019CF72E6|nr:malonyl-ACP O-methyltransferase BioC [Thalassotalea sp. G2M2-11]